MTADLAPQYSHGPGIQCGDQKVKHVWAGAFVRQHAPDFVDGNTISVFDNNNSAAEGPAQQSRLLLLSAATDERTVYYEDDDAAPFYTKIMGRNQWLPNGNVLITESMRGRAFELDRDKRVVWEYVNLVGDGYAAVMEKPLREFGQEKRYGQGLPRNPLPS